MLKHKLIGLIMVSVAGLAACGGANDTENSATSSKETAMGSVNGFGSIIVDGTRYDDERAVITQETAAGVITEVPLASIELGMQVEVSATAGKAESITIHTTLIGPVESLSTDGFVAAGQSVSVTGDTIYSGASGLDDIGVGDRVSVHGVRGDNDVIQADRIRLRAPDADRLIRIVSRIRDLDQNEQTFRLGRLTVDYSNDPRIVPAQATLADGRAVVVFSSSLPVAGRLQANGLRLFHHNFLDGRRIRIAGLIRDLDPSALTFRLHLTTIDASRAEFVNGSAADLANGRRARVLGTVRIDANGARAIEAAKVWTLGDEDDPVAVSGVVRNYVDAASFTIRGVTIDASASTVRFVNGSTENIANGVLLRVKGVAQGDKIIAESVEFFDPDGDTVRTVAGFIRNADPATNSLQIFRAPVTIDASTRIFHSDGSAAGTDALQNGIWAVARGDVQNGQLVAQEIRLRNQTSVEVKTIEGVVYQVDINRGRFRLNGVAVQVNQQLLGTATLSNLRSGHSVRVTGSWNNGVFTISAITRL